MGTPHPRGPSVLSPLLSQNAQRSVGLLSQEELEPSDFLPTDEVTALSGSACSITTDQERGIAVEGEQRWRNGTCSEGRGVDDRLMVRGKSLLVCVSSEPEAVGEARHVFLLWRRLSSLLKKKNYTGGMGVGWGGGQPHSQENLTKWLRMFPSDNTLFFINHTVLI